MTVYVHPVDPALVFQGLEITLLVAAAARWAGAVSGTGFWAGVSVGGWVSLSLGSPGLLVVGSFFLLGSLATRWRFAEKAGRGLAEPGGGERGAGRVLAKGAVGAALAVAAIFPAFHPDLARTGFVGAFAAAAADTLGTEIGQVLGRSPFTLAPPRRAQPGTPGAVSLAGCLAGLLGASAVAAAAWGAGLLPQPWAIPVVAGAGLLGSLLEAAAAPLLRLSPWRDLAANLFATAAGAALAAGAVALLLPAARAPF